VADPESGPGGGDFLSSECFAKKVKPAHFEGRNIASIPILTENENQW
jgi:hypothetical protein